MPVARPASGRRRRPVPAAGRRCGRRDGVARAAGVDDVDVVVGGRLGSGPLGDRPGVVVVHGWSGLSAGSGGRPSVPTRVWDLTPRAISLHPGAPESRQAPRGPDTQQAMGPQRGSAVLERRETEAPIRVDTRTPGDARRDRRRARDPPRRSPSSLPGSAQLAAGNRAARPVRPAGLARDAGPPSLLVGLLALVSRTAALTVLTHRWTLARAAGRAARPWRCCGRCCSSTRGGSASPTGCRRGDRRGLLVAAARPAARAARRRGLRRHERRGRPRPR